MRRTTTFGRLTWFNTLRLLLVPALLVAMGITGYAALRPFHQPFVLTLSDLHESTVTASMIVSMGMFVATAFPAVREARYGRHPVGPLGPVSRYLALGTASALASWACMAVVVVYIHQIFPDDPVGAVSPISYAAPFLLVLAGPAASLALVAWTRSYTPLVLAVLAVPAYGLYTFATLKVGPSVGMVVSGLDSLTRLAANPFPITSPSIPLLCVLYLTYTGLVLAFLVVLALAGLRRGPYRFVALGACLVLLSSGAGAAVYGATTYSRENPVPAHLLYEAERTPCRVQEGVTYCPMPGYEPWVDRWHDVLGPVMSALPEAAADDVPVVWQTSTHFEREPPDSAGHMVLVYDVHFNDGPWWRSELLSRASQSVFGLGGPRWQGCWATGQSRFLLAAWMSALDDETPEADRYDTAGILLSEYRPSQRDLAVFRALMGTPADRVFALLAEHWNLLASPEGRTEDLVALLDLEAGGSPDVPPDLEDWHRLWPGYWIEELPVREAPVSRCP